MQVELDELKEILGRSGIHEVLRVLDSRTPHRFTGVNRFDGAMLRDGQLCDPFRPDVLRGNDVPVHDACCARLREANGTLEFTDALADPCIEHRPGSAVVSYCGMLIRNDDGIPFGSLCHHDVKPCQKRVGDVPLPEAIAPALFRATRK